VLPANFAEKNLEQIWIATDNPSILDQSLTQLILQREWCAFYRALSVPQTGAKSKNSFHFVARLITVWHSLEQSSRPLVRRLTCHRGTCFCGNRSAPRTTAPSTSTSTSTFHIHIHIHPSRPFNCLENASTRQTFTKQFVTPNWDCVVVAKTNCTATKTKSEVPIQKAVKRRQQDT